MDQHANNKESMKRENRRLVMQLLHGAALSRAELSKKTHLTQAAISSIVEELITEGIIFESGKVAKTQTGRRPITLEINAGWGYVLGISIDHDGIELGLLDLNGKILGHPVMLPYMENVSHALDAIAAAGIKLIDGQLADPKKVIGVGAIAPGPVDAKNGRILNPPGFDSWHGLNLQQELEKRLPYRVFVQHNANAIARAEYSFGLGRQYGSFAELIINTGIGMGLVLKNSVYSGAYGLGSELGHTSVDIHGRQCACGNRGCLEMYASTSAVLYDVRRLRKDIHTWHEFMDACFAGDILCLRMLDDQAAYLAHALINLNNLLELDAVILTGLVLYRGEMLAERIEKHVAAVSLNKDIHSLQICLSPLTEHLPVIAAGAVVTDRLFRHDLFLDLKKEHDHEA